MLTHFMTSAQHWPQPNLAIDWTRGHGTETKKVVGAALTVRPALPVRPALESVSTDRFSDT